MGRLFWILQLGSKQDHKWAHKRGRETLPTEASSLPKHDALLLALKTEAGPMHQGIQGGAGEGKQTDSPRKPAEGVAQLTCWFWPSETDSGLLTYRNVRKSMYVV